MLASKMGRNNSLGLLEREAVPYKNDAIWVLQQTIAGEVYTLMFVQ
jgi:hypothetical protein